MGLIKTGIYAGAAMYGVNRVSKAVSSRGSSPQPPVAPATHEYAPPPRDYYSDRNHTNNAYHPQQHQLGPRDAEYPSDPRDRPSYARDQAYYEADQQGQHQPQLQQQQKLYLEGQEHHQSQAPAYYSHETGQRGNDPPAFENVSSVRSTSIPGNAYATGQQGFVVGERSRALDMNAMSDEKDKGKVLADVAGK